MKLKIQEIAYHRNGVFGRGFYVVLFTAHGETDSEGHRFMGTLFEQEGQCAVIALDLVETCGVGFAKGNSWRGDHFEPELRKAIKRDQEQQEREFKKFMTK